DTDAAWPAAQLHGIDEALVQHLPHVKPSYLGGHQAPHRAHRVLAVHTHELCEIVTGTDRHDAERHGGVLPEEPVRHFVHGAVAAHSHDTGGAVARRLRRALGHVAERLRASHVHGPALALELSCHGVERPGAGAATRCGIEDDMSVDQ